MMREIILDGLLLPLRLYFRPTSFANQVAALAPELPPDYSLWRARHKFRDPIFCRDLGNLLLQGIIALSWILLLSTLFIILGFAINWSGIAQGMAISMAMSLIISLAGRLTLGVASGVTLGIIGSLMVGIAQEMVSGMTTLNSRLVFGVVIGVAASMPIRVEFKIIGSIAVGVTIAIIMGLLIGLTDGFDSGQPIGIAFGLTSILIVTHAIVLPLQALLSFISRIAIRNAPLLSPTLWRISPARWDETILLPLPGLTELLVTLNRVNPQLGRAAIASVVAHRFQHRAAQQALVQLAQEDALLVQSLQGLSAFGSNLDWLSEESQLPETHKSTLLQMQNISNEVASALESDSATNCVRRLTEAQRILKSLQLQPGMFGSVCAQWTILINVGLEEALSQQREQEPIPQVYIKDGRPIRPTKHTDTTTPFKGRATLFRQLESALGGGESERTTLVLYGQRRTGKTSALLQLPRRLGSRIVPAFLDLQSATLGSANNIGGLLSGLADEIGKEVQRHRRLRLPHIDRVALTDDPYPAFGRWLDQVEGILDERTLLLCLDEFETLEDAIAGGRIDTRILSTIRNIVQHRRRIVVLLSGSHQVSELPEHWASALITTTTLKISFLDEPDARELIERPIAGFPAIYQPAAVDYILRMTHCQPYLMQLLCALLVERMNTARRMPPTSFVTVDDVQATIPLVLERGANYFIDLWRSQTGSVVARRVLEELAHAPDMTLDRTAVRQIERDESALREAINTLLQRELIERLDDSYRIIVPLVGAYVQQETQV